MAMNLADPTAQTLVFPASASSVNESSGIFISGMYELIGFFWEAMEATTAVLHIGVTSDSPSILDADATWVQAWDKDGDALAVTEVFTAAGYVAISPDQLVIGPIRVRLEAFASDGSTGVDQDEQVITPVFRSM